MRTVHLAGREVGRLGLGLAAAGRPGYLVIDHDLGDDRSVPTLRARAHDLLDGALAAGITYFDVARSYGLAEDFLAGWAADRAVGADAITIGTKWGYRYTAGWEVEADQHEVKDHSLAHLEAQWAESLALLGDRVTLLQIHSATQDSGVLGDGAVLDRLAAIRESGTMIGVTVSGPDQRDLVRRAMEVEYDGAFLFATVQATWNLLERSATPALAEAHDEGIGVILKEAVANGRLVDPGHVLASRWEALADAAGDHRPDQFALGAALARPFADVVLSGASSPEQLASNLGALDLSWDDDLERRVAGLAEPTEEYWTYRAALAWT